MTTPLTFGDCHTHLDQYDEAELPGILERAAEAGVTSVLLAGTTLESIRECIRLAERYDAFYAGVGIHPCNAWERVDDAMYAELERLAQQPKVVTISEVGLDYLPESPDLAVQDQVFRAHIRLAKSLELPIIFHSRAEEPRGVSTGKSHAACFKVLREEQAGEVGGAMHYFQADEATAREAIDCGFYISLARPLTRLPEVQAAARAIPLEHIVLETDAYPQPFKKYRHNWTEPRHVAEVAQCLAEVKGVSIEEVAAVTTANYRKMVNRRGTII